MQAEFPCPLHDGQELSYICLEAKCKEEKVYCDQCMPIHNGHKKLAFAEYKKIYAEFNELSSTTYKSIKNMFKELSHIVDICLKKAEDRVLKQFCGVYTPESFPTIGSVEIQQFYGMIEQVLSNPILIEMLKGKPSISVSMELQKYKEDLENKIIELQSEIVVSINRFASQSEYYMSEIKRKENYGDQFFFSKHLKNSFLKVQGDGKILMRPSADMRGLSVYGLVDKPLTVDNNKIGFKILNQYDRFIYFGACIPDLFSKHKFMGPVYQIGNGMFAIRQNNERGKPGYTLHHSLMTYSNKPMVGWDFEVGDKLVLQYLESENQLLFSCNDKYIFRMPISNDGSKHVLYPFVGMKYDGEQIMILSKKQCDQPASLIKQDPQNSSNLSAISKIKKSKFPYF